MRTGQPGAPGRHKSRRKDNDRATRAPGRLEAGGKIRTVLSVAPGRDWENQEKGKNRI
jgi:hypothetical protein